MGTKTWSRLNKVGLGMQLFYGLVNVPSFLQEPGTDKKMGPPPEILWADTVLGVVLVVAAIVAWRQGSRSIAWLASVSNILISATGIPAFFIDGLPSWVAPVMTVSIIWTIVSVALTHRSTKTPAT